MGPETAKKISIEHVNILQDEDLMSEFSLLVPVILVNEDIVCESRIDIPSIRQSILSHLEVSS